MTALVIEPPAAAALRDAASWYEEQSPVLGDRLLDAIEDALEQIRRFPEAGAPVPFVAPDLLIRRGSVRRFPFQVIYLAKGETLHVLAFAHDSRRPGYWLYRFHR